MRLLWFVLTLIIGPAFATTPDYCRDISNVWNVSNTIFCGVLCGTGISTWQIFQDNTQNQQISGRIDHIYCPADGTYYDAVAINSAQSTVLGPGDYNGLTGMGYRISASVGNNSNCDVYDKLVIKLGERGCSTLWMVDYSPAQIVGAEQTAIPYNGETSEFQGWAYGGMMVTKAVLDGPYLAGTLGHDVNYNWSGRQVQEEFTNQANDPVQCKTVNGAGGADTWVLNKDPGTGSNSYTDYNGYPYEFPGVGGPYSPFYMGFLRTLTQPPCGQSWTQVMSMDIPGSNPWATYDSHPLVNQISSQTSIYIERSVLDTHYEAYGFTSGMYVLVIEPPPNFAYYYHH